MNYDWIKTRSDYDEVKAAVIDPQKGTEWSYQDMNIRAENLANHIKDQGIKRGDVVGIFAPNDVAIFDLLFASFKMGVVFLPINWRLKPKEIQSIIADSGVKMIFYSLRHKESLTGTPEELLHMDIDSEEYDEICNPKNHRPFETVDVESDELASLMYTSGTTGLPKGVMFTYESYVSNVINAALTYKTNSKQISIISTPMFHVLGLNDTALPIIMAGGTLVLHRYFDGAELNDLMAKYKPDYLIMIPTMYYGMLAAENFNPANFENIEYLIQGGSSPLPAVQKKFESMGLTLINGYGLTEAPLAMVNTPHNSKVKPMAIGKPIMYMDMKLFDDDGSETKDGEIGELAVKGKNVTPGYWNKPKETAESFTDGYFLTGDLARKDEDGDIYIVNRKKELIITGGENVLPSEVEAALSEHPIVRSAIVVGYDNPEYGESVSAAIVLAEETENFEEILDAHIRERVAGYKIPRLYLKMSDIPLNSTAKPDRLEIQKLMNEKAKEKEVNQ
ncbi:long-chain-fatty-acid--CoA ligase FadD [Salinicoccus sp. Marseille-QA3877]